MPGGLRAIYFFPIHNFSGQDLDRSERRHGKVLAAIVKSTLWYADGVAVDITVAGSAVLTIRISITAVLTRAVLDKDENISSWLADRKRWKYQLLSRRWRNFTHPSWTPAIRSNKTLYLTSSKIMGNHHHPREQGQGVELLQMSVDVLQLQFCASWTDARLRVGSSGAFAPALAC